MRATVRAASLGVAALAACGPADDRPNAAEVDTGFLSLADFEHVGEGAWTEADGEIHGSGEIPQNVIVTPDSYGDVNIRLEFWVSEGGNSGVFLRCEDRDNVTDATCYEANIFDERPDQSGRTGAIVNIAPPLVDIDADGQWNSYDITIEGSHITVVLNGETTVDVEDRTHPDPGPIALQAGPGEARFRNIVITER